METLFVENDKIKVLQKIVDSIDTLKNVIVTDDVSDDEIKTIESKGKQVLRWSAFLTSHEGKDSNETAPSNSGLDRIAVVMFTSGSTGVPKGVCLTNKNFMWVFKYLFDVLSSVSGFKEFTT